MTDLAQISLQRAGLPTFPGATVQDQLVNGRDTALAVLRKYKPDLVYDEAATSLTMRQIQAWEDRNADVLQSVMQSSTEALPDAVKLAFGSDKAQAFIVGGFVQAAVGLGPWLSPSDPVGRAVATSKPGDVMQQQWAQADAAARLQIFGSIVKMDQDGYLSTLFVRPSGLGFLPIAIEGSTLVWALVVTVVAVAAIIVGYLYLSKTVELNNRLMRDLCEKAQREGDKATVNSCIAATSTTPSSPWIPLAVAAGVIGVAYIAAAVVLPQVLRRRR